MTRPASPWGSPDRMNPPSTKALNRWIQDQPRGEYTCAWCGKTGPDHYVQPQHPFYADGRQGVDGKAPGRCTDCITAAHREHRAARKAQLAAAPRCEVPGCNRRGAWTCAGALLCGGHLKKARIQHARLTVPLGILGGLMEYNKTAVLTWAQGELRP